MLERRNKGDFMFYLLLLSQLLKAPNVEELFFVST